MKKAAKTTKAATKVKVPKVVERCDSCGIAVDPAYGVAECPECFGVSCVQYCILDGVNTRCVECEEVLERAEDDEQDDED